MIVGPAGQGVGAALFSNRDQGSSRACSIGMPSNDSRSSSEPNFLKSFGEATTTSHSSISLSYRAPA